MAAVLLRRIWGKPLAAPNRHSPLAQRGERHSPGQQGLGLHRCGSGACHHGAINIKGISSVKHPWGLRGLLGQQAWALAPLPVYGSAKVAVRVYPHQTGVNAKRPSGLDYGWIAVGTYTHKLGALHIPSDAIGHCSLSTLHGMSTGKTHRHVQPSSLCTKPLGHKRSIAQLRPCKVCCQYGQWHVCRGPAIKEVC